LYLNGDRFELPWLASAALYIHLLTLTQPIDAIQAVGDHAGRRPSTFAQIGTLVDVRGFTPQWRNRLWMKTA
jgi:hypothetical protein